MLTKSFLHSLSIILLSTILCIFIVNLLIGIHLKDQDKKFMNVCSNYNNEDFTNSLSFSLANGYYPIRASIEHCNKEFRYTYHINDFGLRNSSIDINDSNNNVDTDTSTNNILALGDSFTFGFGVEDKKTYPFLLKAHNAGIWGASFDTQFISFKRSVELIKPKTIVWGIYPPHVITMMPGGWSRDCPKDARFQIPFPKIINIPVSFWNNSSIGKYFMNRGYIREIKMEGNSLQINRDCYKTKEVLLYDSSMSGSSYTTNSITNEEFLNNRREVYTKLEKIFKEAGEIARDKEIKIYFLLIPSKMQLMLEDKRYTGIYDPSNLDANFPFRNFKNILLKSGFSEDSIIDLSEYFLNEENKNTWQEYFFVEDAHWNEKGNEFVADIIKERMEKFKEETKESTESKNNEYK